MKHIYKAAPFWRLSIALFRDALDWLVQLEMRRCGGQLAASRARSLCSMATLTLAETVPLIFEGNTKASLNSMPLEMDSNFVLGAVR